MRRECRERFSPATDLKGNRDVCRDRLPAVAGKTFPALPMHAQHSILRIWQEAHGTKADSLWYISKYVFQWFFFLEILSSMLNDINKTLNKTINF